MKHLKRSLLLSILCPVIFFINCTNSDNPKTENNTTITDENYTQNDSKDDKTNEIPFKILTSNSKIEISKSWIQEPKGYTYSIDVHIPNEDMPLEGFPACILLHGNGG